MSNNVGWILSEEYFEDDLHKYNIHRAKALVMLSPREIVEKKLSFSVIRAMRNTLINQERADFSNLEIPIILTPDGKIIDGWHRVYKAFKMKKKFVLAVQLTEKELEEVREDLYSDCPF